jgi:hypothetical protein
MTSELMQKTVKLAQYELDSWKRIPRTYGKDDVQKMITISFQLAMVSAEHMHGKDNYQIAEWVAEQLRVCGFDTEPCGASWGLLKDK